MAEYMQCFFVHPKFKLQQYPLQITNFKISETETKTYVEV